ncbi:MAG: type II CAAX endopeptidase family protein [Dehalococcoidia bacterium]
MAYERALPPFEPLAEPSPAPDRAPWGYADMAMAIGVIIGCLIVLGTPIVLIVQALADVNLEDAEGEAAVGVGGGVLVEALLFAVAALFTVRKYNLSWSALGLRRPKRGGLLFPIPVCFGAAIIIFVTAGIMSAAGAEPEGNVPEETFDATALIVLLGVVSLGLAPFVEETFFRGFLFGGLRGRVGMAGAALVSGLVFALAHFTGAASLPLLPAIAAIGMLFAWAYYYTDSLYASIMAHFTFNLVSFVVGVTGAGT